MSARSVITLLRLPFGLFLSPIALFALAVAAPLDPLRCLLIMVAIHFFLYPASHGFNSFYDHDRGPIGGLAHPPRPTIGLLRVSLALDAIALAIAFLVSVWLALGLLVYGLASKAYSWDRTRLKARPIVSMLLITLGQGALTFLMVAWWAGSVPVLPAWLGSNATESLWLTGQAVGGWLGPIGVIFSQKLLFGAALAALFLAGVYPLTQVYQHEEDGRRGDLSYSRLVGIKGTFISSGLFFVAVGIGFCLFFWLYSGWLATLIFLVCLAPAALVFFLWTRAVWRDPAKASFTWMMRLNMAAVIGMDIFLLLVIVGIPRLTLG